MPWNHKRSRPLIRVIPMAISKKEHLFWDARNAHVFGIVSSALNPAAAHILALHAEQLLDASMRIWKFPPSGLGRVELWVFCL